MDLAFVVCFGVQKTYDWGIRKVKNQGDTVWKLKKGQ